MLELSRAAAELMISQFEKAASKASRREGEDLTLKNFVRRKDEVNRLLNGPLPKALKKAAKSVLNLS